MKKLVIINGSPKKAGSASGKLAGEIAGKLSGEIACEMVSALQLSQARHPDAILRRIAGADVLLFIFPLYADALPASLMHAMSLIHSDDAPAVYAICNCGFYEAAHTRLAMRIVKHFCEENAFRWRGGIAIGGGALINVDKELARPPTHLIHRALESLVQKMVSETPDVLIDIIEPPMPRWLYQKMGALAWLPKARRNGVLLPVIASLWRKPQRAVTKEN